MTQAVALGARRRVDTRQRQQRRGGGVGGVGWKHVFKARRAYGQTRCTRIITTNLPPLELQHQFAIQIHVAIDRTIATIIHQIKNIGYN